MNPPRADPTTPTTAGADGSDFIRTRQPRRLAAQRERENSAKRPLPEIRGVDFGMDPLSVYMLQRFISQLCRSILTGEICGRDKKEEKKKKIWQPSFSSRWFPSV